MPDRKQVEAAFATGVAAYDNGDYARAHAAWLPLAEAGDLAAQRNIGFLYESGRGVAADGREAARWYRKAADAGFHRAQANLANLYLKGEGVAQDDREAATWFHRAALQGHAVAQYNLGVMYQQGRGVERDLPRALGWLQLAAKAGHPQAQEAVEQIMAADPPPGIPDSLKGELKLARAAPPKPAEPTPPPAPAPPAKAPESWTGKLRGFLGLAEKQDEPPPAAAAEPVPYVSAAAPPAPPQPRVSSGDAVAQGLAAYHSGRPDRARALWEPPARGGDPLAQFYLGGLYRVGMGVPLDPVSAYLWWSLAARGGHEAAKEQLIDLTSEMSLGQLVEGEKRLKAWRPGA